MRSEYERRLRAAAQAVYEAEVALGVWSAESYDDAEACEALDAYAAALDMLDLVEQEDAA